MNFLDTVASRYGNPNARFAASTDRLKSGQPVRLFVENGSKLIDGRAAGKKENGRHVVWVTINNRRWRVRPRSKDLLVNW